MAGSTRHGRPGVEGRRNRRVEFALCAAVAVAFAAPLALCRYFPGLDLPWHAAIVEIWRSDDPTREFLGYFSVGGRFTSYLTLYLATSWLAELTGHVATAIQVVIAVYVVAFILGAYALIRAFGGSGLTAVLAAPAAYSMSMEFGFLAYSLAYPMTFLGWTVAAHLVRDAGQGWRRSAAWGAGLLALSGLIAVTHPFAAAVFVAGAAVIVATHLERATVRRGLAALAALLAGVLPAVWAVASLTANPGVARGGSLGGPTTQQFSAPLDSLAHLPGRLFGFVGPGWAVAFLVAGLAAAWARRRASGSPDADPGMRGRSPGWLVAVLAALYLVTPFSFEWPRFWYAAQPRLLPLLWVAVLVWLRAGPAAPSHPRRWRAAPLAVSVVSLAVLVWGTWIPFAAEAREFRAVITQAAPRQMTLGLIEQPRTIEGRPPSPWRNATAYLLVERHGFVSGLPFARTRAGNPGILVPVEPHPDAPPMPRGLPPIATRAFWWDRDAGPWDQFLIRDLDLEAPFDFFREHIAEVTLVARAGRWRLYRRRAAAR